MRTDTGPACPSAESRTAAAETGEAVGRQHLQYIADLMTVVQTLDLSGGEKNAALQAVFWTAYARTIIAGMCLQVGEETAAYILLTLARDPAEGPPSHGH